MCNIGISVRTLACELDQETGGKMLRFRGVLFGCMAAATFALAGCGIIPNQGESIAQGRELTHAEKIAQADAACAARKAEPAIAGTARRIAAAPTAMFRTQNEIMLISFPCTLAAQLRKESKN